MSLLLSQLGGAAPDEGLPWVMFSVIDEEDFLCEDSQSDYASIDSVLVFDWIIQLCDFQEEEDTDTDVFPYQPIDETLVFDFIQQLCETYDIDPEDFDVYHIGDALDQGLVEDYGGVFVGEEPGTIVEEQYDYDPVSMATIYDEAPIVTTVNSQWILRYRRRGRR